jgi:hypothetical protein
VTHADLDRANRDDLAAGRQRVVGRRAGVRPQLDPQGAGAGRITSRGTGRGLRGAAVPCPVRTRRRLARLFCHGADTDADRACPHAGGAAAPCRQRHLQGRQRAEDISFDAFQEVYREAYRSGCKGCTTYRPNAITGSVLSTTPAAADPAVTTVPPPHGPLPRPAKLTGSTYKLRWVDSAHALYITINDLEEEGRRRPFEVFISSANMEHFSWVVALTRMISAVFRRGGEVGFVADELKGIFDPRGGQWSDGRYVPSLIAAIGGIIEQHMIETGFIAAQEPSLAPVAPVGTSAGGLGLLCPKCSQPGVVKEGACLTCHHCGWSKCG